MGDMFPELRKNPQHVIDMIKDEELSFGKTLDRGIALFEEAANRLPNSSKFSNREQLTAPLFM